jgi:hypothetical protein
MKARVDAPGGGAVAYNERKRPIFDYAAFLYSFRSEKP